MASKNPDSQQPEQKIDRSKRKLTQAGGLAVPAILTLANRPAWGTDICTPSGFDSVNAPGALASQATPLRNEKWLTPSAWRAEKPKTGSTVIACNVAYLKKDTSKKDKYQQVSGFNLWGSSPSSKSESEIRKNYSQLIFVDQLIGGDKVSVTIYDALGSDDLRAYRLANQLNNCVSPLPSAILTSTNLSDIKAFYNSCAS
jgi:hypothetical protein